MAVQQTCVVPNANVAPDAGLHTIVGVSAHLSRAVTTYETAAPLDDVHSAVMSAGHVITGGALSMTVTSKQHRDEFCRLSVAVQHTVVVPKPKVEPDAGEQTTITFGSHASDADASNETIAPVGPEHSAVMFPGQVIVGGSESTTVTLKQHRAEFCSASVAVQQT